MSKYKVTAHRLNFRSSPAKLIDNIIGILRQGQEGVVKWSVQQCGYERRDTELAADVR